MQCSFSSISYLLRSPQALALVQMYFACLQSAFRSAAPLHAACIAFFHSFHLTSPLISLHYRVTQSLPLDTSALLVRPSINKSPSSLCILWNMKHVLYGPVTCNHPPRRHSQYVPQPLHPSYRLTDLMTVTTSVIIRPRRDTHFSLFPFSSCTVRPVI